ncbi:YkvA family protein [Pedomonas sp. V897]|uniref:YkvA family protein n=1 Tax=Pedomonas sp. V897 TaxID=3446482 RepID=UPI003EE30E6C
MPKDQASATPPLPEIPMIDVADEAGNAAAVDQGFWDKVRRLAGRLPFADTLVAAWFCARDPETPPRVRAMLLGALAYFVMPIDLIPDFLLHLGGFTDDAAVLATVIGLVGANIKPRHRAAARKALDLPPLPEEEAPILAEPPKRKKRFGLF